MGVAAPGAKSRVQPCTSVILVRNNVTYNPAVRLALYIEMHTQTSPATAVRADKWILNEQYHHYNDWEYICRLGDLNLLPIINT